MKKLISILLLSFILFSCDKENPVEPNSSLLKTQKSNITHFDSLSVGTLIIPSDAFRLTIKGSGLYWDVVSVGSTSLTTYQTDSGEAGLKTQKTEIEELQNRLNELEQKFKELQNKN